MENTLTNLLKLIGSVIPLLGSFLYYLGRRFTEAYYNTLGVPFQLLNLSISDYMFDAIKSWLFLVALAQTFIIIVLWRTITKKPDLVIIKPEPNDSNKKWWDKTIYFFANTFKTTFKAVKYKKGDPQLLLLGLFFYFIFLVLLFLLILFTQTKPNLLAETGLEIILLISTVFLAWLIITDKPTINYMVLRRRLLCTFAICVIIIIIISAQLLPHTLGNFAGINSSSKINIENNMPKVMITAKEYPSSSGILWNRTANGLYMNNEALFLVFSGNDGLFVKKADNTTSTFLIPRNIISGIEIIIPRN